MNVSTLNSLPGVTLVADIIVSNQSSVNVTSVINEGEDLTNFLVLGLPFLLCFFVGIGFVNYYTDDDGYVTGARKVESEFRAYRYLSTFLTYFVEAVQIAACSFGVASVESLKHGDSALDVLGVWLFRGSSFFAAFPAVVAIEILMILVMFVPAVLWKVLERDLYNKFANYYVYGPFGPFISFVQDCFMLYLTIPFFIILLMPVVCTYYETGEPATALFGETECGSSRHQKYALLGSAVAACVFAMGSAMGTIPVLVERANDLALNGRFTSTAFAIKCCMAVTYVLFAERHQYYQTGTVFVLLCILLFLNITLRPCLVERINFHRSAGYCLALAPCVMVITASGLDDVLNPLPVTLGITVSACIFALLVVKYFLLTSGKLFPAIPYMGGMYEGGICLGLSLPHGYGILRWEAENQKVFAGAFFFGRYHGYGVVTQLEYFFQGMHKLGLREGFGVTNMMPEDQEKSYEGEWLNNLYHGRGTKRFDNGDVYEGDFIEGIEHGEGEWFFETVMGVASAHGTFRDGIFTNVQLEEHEHYTGEIRYGVPHGLGKMMIDDDVYDGEWRAGKLHGNAKVTLETGEYEGMLIEGNFNEEGTWRDAEETFTGRWKDGLKHGQGIQELECGRYEGQFYEGDRHGYGMFSWKDGTVYQGSWQHNDYHGAGLLRTANGAEYDGNWNQGRKHGTRGCMTHPNGDTYIGGWSEDEYHEHGVLKLVDLGEYNGRFEFGKKHGLGRFTFNDGSEYIGEWADDFAQGEGHFVFSNRKALVILQVMSLEDASVFQSSGERYFLDYGGVYDGDFAEGAMNGQGTVVCGDGTIFKGEWADGLPHGHGTITYPGGGEYIGEFYAGLRDGIGTMTYEDARLYRGSWEGGKRHGHGVLFSAEGDVLHECEWTGDIPSDVVHEEQAQLDIPVVDVDELLRAIMPSHSSEEEMAETRARRRMELEEVCEATAIRVWVEEELAYRRIVKNYLTALERVPRSRIIVDEEEAVRELSKPIIVKLLNQWKAAFRIKYEREPKKSDIMYDGFIAPFYVRYQEITKAEK
jgi:hypothetical protein